MRALASVLVVALLAGGIYYFYIRRLPMAAEGTAATQAISLTGVQNDLLSIAQAERTYMVQNGNCGSMDELVSSGALAVSKPVRAGYTYVIECSGGNFTVTASHAPAPAGAQGVRYPAMTIDQTMQVRQSD